MDSTKEAMTNLTQYYCFLSQEEQIIIWAKDTGTAKAECLAKYGKEPLKIVPALTRDAAEPVLVPQKNLKGLLDNMNVILFLWLVVITPVFHNFIPRIDFSRWNEFILPGAGFFLVAFICHYLRLLFTTELTARDPVYGNKTFVLVLNAVLCAIFIGICIVFLPVKNENIKYSIQSAGFLVAIFLVIYPFIFAFRWNKGFRSQAAYRNLLGRLKGFPYTLALLSLFSLPAISIAAQASRELLFTGLRPLWDLIRNNIKNLSRLFDPVHGNRLQMIVLFFIVMGPMVYAFLVLAFSRITPSLDKDNNMIRSKNMAGAFILGYLAYLAELLFNIAVTSA